MSGNRAGVRHNSWTTTKYYEPRRLPNGQPIALRRNGTIYYMQQDQLGNLALVTSGGAAVNDQGFYAYGRAQRAPGCGIIGV